MATTHTSCFRQILNPLFDLYYVLEIITFGNYNGLDAGPLTLLSPYILSLVNANGPTSVECHMGLRLLTHWGRVTDICVGKLTIIGSDNGLSPERRQAIIWTNARILLIGPLGTNFSEILIEIQTFSLKKIHLKMSSAICCSFCLGLNVLSGKTEAPWRYEYA